MLDDAWSVFVVVGTVGAACALYLLPSLLAFDRKVPNKWSVVVLNVLLGWTLVGWAVALAMAVRDRPQPAV